MIDRRPEGRTTDLTAMAVAAAMAEAAPVAEVEADRLLTAVIPPAPGVAEERLDSLPPPMGIPSFMVRCKK